MSEEPWTISQIHQLREETSVSLSLKIPRFGNDSSIACENSAQSVFERDESSEELAIQGSNDTYSLDDLSIWRKKSNLKERVFNLANTEFNGRYVFSGTAYDTHSFR